MISKIKNKYQSLSVQVKASVWFLICSFLQKGISTITTPIFTRLLTTEEYGAYNVFNSWLNIVTIFVTLNLCFGVYTQGLVKFSEERNIYSSSLQGLTVCLTILWTGIYLLFHSFWNELFSLTTVQMLAMLVMIWATAAFNFWAAEQRVLYRYKALVIVTLFVSLAKPLIGILFVVNAEDKVTARILGLVLVEVIGYTALFIIQMRNGKVFFSKKYWKYAVMYNLPLIPHYLSQTVLNSTDRIMIKDICGDSDAGIYSLAYSISLIMTLFNTALMNSLSPWIYQKIKSKQTHEIASTAYLSLIVIAVFNLMLIICAPEIIAIFAPKQYYDAIWIIPPVAISVYFMYSYDLYAKFGFYYEKTKFIMLASVVGAVLNIVLNYIFIRMFGYIAAGYTTLVCYVLYSVAHYLCMRKVCKDNMDNAKVYDTRIIVGFSSAFIVLGFLIMLTYKAPVVRYSLIATVLIACIILRKKIMQLMSVLLKSKKK